MFGFGAIGVDPVGIGPRGGQIITSLIVDPGAYALTGNVAAFKVLETVAAGAYALTGTAASFKVLETTAVGSYVLTGNAATFKTFENVASGAYALTGNAAVEEPMENVSVGSYLLTGNDAPLTRTGADFDLVYGGVGHFLEELEKKRQLEKITRKTPAPIDRTTRPVFAPIGRPPVSAPAPAPDVAAMQNQRMADEMRASAQAKIAKRRRDETALLLLAS